MTDVRKQAGRIPQESLSGDDSVATWKLPAMGKPGKVVKSAKREKRSRVASETIEDLGSRSKPKPLTAEELQKIADQAQQEGYADGFKEGMEKGLQQGETKGLQLGEHKAYAELKPKLLDEQQRFSTIATQLMEPMGQQDAGLEKLVLELVMGVSRHLLADEITASPSKLMHIVQRALAALPVGAKNIRVSVNEADARLLETVIPAEHRNWQLLEDDSLHSGGCRIETEESLVNYSIEARLNEFLSHAEEMALDPEPLQVEAVQSAVSTETAIPHKAGLTQGVEVEQSSPRPQASAALSQRSSADVPARPRESIQPKVPAEGSAPSESEP